MNAMDEVYSTFTRACETGDLEEVKFLIQSNPKLDIHQYNENALSLAGHYGHANVVKFLMEAHQADVLACDTDMFETAAEFGFLDIIKYLAKECEIGTDNSDDTYGFVEALLTAANREHENVVKYLIDRGVKHKGFKENSKTAYEFCEKFAQEKRLKEAMEEAFEMASDMALKNAKKAEKLFKSNVKSLQKIGVKRPVRRRPSGAPKGGSAK